MAIAPTGAIYKTLTFDGVSSADFGVYITGEAVFNAPQRDVEMVTIPGRNGTFALDNGRFENIEVSYPAGIFADTEADFAEAVSEFRNFLCSRNGYVRLEDDYNASEYRMAVYKSGLEVTPALLKAGEFTLTFDCKPQRWLTSGEEAITVDSGDTITNPTRFEAGPLLEVEGYGDITVGGGDLSVTEERLGRVVIARDTTGAGYTNPTGNVPLETTLLNEGDEIISDGNYCLYVQFKVAYPSYSIVADPPTKVTSTSNCSASFMRRWSDNAIVRVIPSSVPSFYYGTAGSYSMSLGVQLYIIDDSSPLREYYPNAAITLTLTYDGADTIGYTMSVNWSGSGAAYVTGTYPYGIQNPTIYGDSSDIVSQGTIYIDLDIGEAYVIRDGQQVSANNIVSLPPELPTLTLGNNEITYDNTVSSLKITPRWWKI